MVASIFQPYIQSLCRHYAEWWTLYTLTDVEGRKVAKSGRNKRISPFDFDLMVRSINTKAPETSNQEKPEKPERQPVLKGLRDSLTDAKHVLLIGRPGSGKSTALARLLLEEAQYSQENIEETFRIPVLVELRYYQTSVIDLIRDFFRRHELSLETHQVETLLSKNRLLLLIDGLNELSSQEAAQQDIAKLRNYRNVRMIFTTRDLSLGGDFGIEKQWEMLPLTETQMQTFIRSHLSPEQAEAMWRQLKDRTRKFAETPLLLWMLCELFEAGEEIPRNLGEVFRIFTQTYENSSIRKHEVAALKGDVQPLGDRRLWFPALKHLASVMMQGETPVDSRTVIERGEVEREFKALFRDEPHSAKTARDCLDDLLNYHLLQIKTDNEIEFRHQLIQEYYAAEWLLDRLPELSDEQLKYYFLNYLKWTEIISLTLGLVDKGDHAIQVVKLALAIDLVLGAKLAGAVNSCLQYQAIDEITKYQLPRACEVYLLGSTQSKEAIEALVEALEEENHWIRNNAIQSLGEIKDSSAVTGIVRAIQDTNLTNRIIAIRALARFNDKQAIDGLKQALNHEDSTTSTEAKRSLENLMQQQETQQEILASPIENNTDYLQLSFDEFEKLNLEIDEEFCHFFVKHVENIFSDKQLSKNFNNWIYVSKFMNWLGRKNDSKATELLTKLSSFKYSYWICRSTKTSLKIIPILRIKRQHYWIRRSAIEALGETNNEKVISVLISSLEDRDWGACESAEIALEKLSISEAITPIKNFLLKGDRPYLLSTISKIQERCKFYNHDIAQSPTPPAVKQETRTENRAQTLNINSVGILNTGDVDIQGNQIGDTSNG